MTIHVLNFTLKLTDLIRKAKRNGVIAEWEAEFLVSMTHHSDPAESTRTLVHAKELPDFLYAALYFSTMVWHSGDAAENDDQARAGFMLAQFVLTQESPDHDQYWAAKLLNEFYQSHEALVEQPKQAVSWVA